MAGGIRILKRRWNISSDDFVISGVFSIILEIFWFSALVWIWAHMSDLVCRDISLLNGYVRGTTVIAGISATTTALLIYHSSRGGISNEEARKYVPYLVLFRYLIVLVEFAFCTIGSLIAFNGSFKCVDTAQDALYQHLLDAVVISSWVMFSLALCRSWLSYDRIGHSKYNDNDAVARHLWKQRLKTVCSCLVPTNQHAVFDDLSEAFFEIFGGEDMTPSDVLAGLRLVHQWQKETGLLKPEYLQKNSTPLASNDARLYESLFYHFRYAQGAYGWPMLQFIKPCTGVCHLLGQCGKDCFVTPEPIKADNCCNCSFAALKYTAALGDHTRMIYADYANAIGSPQFFVVVDDHSIVVCVRGTLSLHDAITDGLAKLAEFELYGFGPTRTHAGILASARTVLRKLETHVRLEAVVRDPRHASYQLIICGHSLGAGVATLLSSLLRENPLYRSLVCYAYAPPGAMFEKEAAVFSEQYVTSFVIGLDLVPRLSFRSVLKLREHVLRAIKHCRSPKYAVMTGVHVQRKPDPWWTLVNPAPRLALPSDDVHSPDAHPNMYPGGRIMLFVQQKEKVRGKIVFSVEWADREHFQDILVAARMIGNHVPTKLPDVINAPSVDTLLTGSTVLSMARHAEDNDHDDDDDRLPFLNRDDDDDDDIAFSKSHVVTEQPARVQSHLEL